MPNSYVTSAEIDGNNIVLSIDVGAFTPGEYVEISGYATQTAAPETQVDTGFATFSEIQEIKAAKPGKPGKTDELKVKAKLTKEFKKDLDITVAVRVAKVWVTVLSAVQVTPAVTQPPVAGQGSKWGWVKGVGGPDEYSSGEGSADQTAAGASSAPTAG